MFLAVDLVELVVSAEARDLAHTVGILELVASVASVATVTTAQQPTAPICTQTHAMSTH